MTTGSLEAISSSNHAVRCKHTDTDTLAVVSVVSLDINNQGFIVTVKSHRSALSFLK